MILVTGATSGIGEATARTLAREGKNLFLIGRRSDRLITLEKELKNSHSGVRILSSELDVRDQEAIDRFAEKYHQELNDLAALINNAGLALGLSGVQDVTPDQWNAMIDTNIKGLLAMTRVVLPGFLKKKEGHIVNIGSVAGHWVYPKGNVYCATKFAVKALTEGMRQDLNGTGIRVTEVSPGMVETEFSEVRLKDREKAKTVYAGMIPLTAEDIAETIVWCLNRPRHVNIQEVILYPTDQASPTLVNRKS